MTQVRAATIPVGLIRAAAVDGQPMAVLVYGALDGFYGGCVAGIWPGHARLAVQLRVSRRTVQRALSWLAAEGWVTITRRIGADGRQITNGYRLHDDADATRDVSDDDAVHARFMARAERELYARALDEVDADPVDNGGQVSDSDPSDPSAWVVTGDVGPTSRVTHNPYFSSRNNWPTPPRLVDNPDPDPHDLDGVDTARLHIAAAFAAVGLPGRRPLRPL